MKYRRIDSRDLLARQAKRSAATRPAYDFCPKCGRSFFGRGVCRHCRKAAHRNRGEGVRHV